MSLSLFTASISAEETAAEPVSVREGVIEAHAKNSTYTYIDGRTGYVVRLIAVNSRY